MLKMVVYDFEKDWTRRIWMCLPADFNKIKITPTSYKLVEMSACYVRELISLFEEGKTYEVSYKLEDELEADLEYRVYN